MRLELFLISFQLGELLINTMATLSRWGRNTEKVATDVLGLGILRRSFSLIKLLMIQDREVDKSASSLLRIFGLGVCSQVQQTEGGSIFCLKLNFIKFPFTSCTYINEFDRTANINIYFKGRFS